MPIFETIFETSQSRYRPCRPSRWNTVPVLASSRTYDRPDGTDIKQAKGLFFGAIPAGFAIRLGESAVLQGVSQGSAAEDYRYNYGLVETTGEGAAVTVTLRSASGSPLASADYALGAREARQVNVGALFPGIATDNARLEATVSGGTGAVLFYGTLLANGSQDSIGFEMSFKDSLLVEGVDTAAAKNAANLAVSTAALTRAVWDVAPRVGVQPVGKTVVAEIPFTARWDDATQTWTVDMTLSTGQTASVKIQFRDAAGTPSKLYRATDTNSIWIYGTAGNGSFDLTVSGVKAGVANLTANGTVSGSYQGTSGTGTVANLVIPKTAGAYPTTGTIVVQSDGITVTVTFDGTRYAQGTYEFRALTVRFTINLDTGEIVFL